jgi:hypothetical protein
LLDDQWFDSIESGVFDAQYGVSLSDSIVDLEFDSEALWSLGVPCNIFSALSALAVDIDAS